MSPGSARVLVVEDDTVLRDCLRDGFADAGYQVTARPDGRDFEHVVADTRPDIAVLDVMFARADPAWSWRPSYAGTPTPPCSS